MSDEWAGVGTGVGTGIGREGIESFFFFFVNTVPTALQQNWEVRPNA